ncbi:MAG: 4-hydroxy-tetrahydrodipicolinate synthase [Acidimicrobiia bacterium]
MGGRFGSVLTAMVTPFDDNGALDLDRARDLARLLADEGNDGLVIAGTTGEAPTLTDDEKLSLWAAVAEAVTIPVIAGSGSNDTGHSVHLTAEAAKLGIAGILAVGPYYNRPSQAGMEAHFRAIAAAAPALPVMLYDIPVRTGRKIATATLLKLCREVTNVVALKDAAGSPGDTAGFISTAPDIDVYSGDDALTLPLLAVGAVGVVSVASHWTTPDQVEMFALWEKGDTAGARRINSQLVESWAYETGEEAPNPVPTKAMLRVVGRPVGQCRLPMGPEPDWLEPRAREVWANLERARGTR